MTRTAAGVKGREPAIMPAVRPYLMMETAVPIDDDEPTPRTPLLAIPPLDRLGVAELQAYIVGLQTEIARAQAEITRKDGLRTLADSFFRKP